jgi:hypothetical protein
MEGRGRYQQLRQRPHSLDVVSDQIQKSAMLCVRTFVRNGSPIRQGNIARKKSEDDGAELHSARVVELGI